MIRQVYCVILSYGQDLHTFLSEGVELVGVYDGFQNVILMRDTCVILMRDTLKNYICPNALEYEEDCGRKVCKKSLMAAILIPSGSPIRRKN